MEDKMDNETLVNTKVIDDMIKENIVPGTKIEITLNEDAAFYDGSTPAPTTNPMGYEKFDAKYHEERDKRPNMHVVGFVNQFKKDRLSLVNVWPLPLKAWAYDVTYIFVHNDVIASYIADVPKK